MTPLLATIAPPADPAAARFVLVLFVGVLLGAGLVRVLDWWDARAARPVCLNCGVVPVDEVGEYCSRCSRIQGRLHGEPRRPGDGGQVEPHRSVRPRPSPGRVSHGVVPAPDRRWEG